MADPRSITVTDIKREPMVVKIGGTNYGSTVGGVTISITITSQEQRADQYDGPLNTWITGLDITCSFTMLETDYTAMDAVFPMSTIRSSGGTAVGWGGKVPGAVDAQTDGVTINLHPAAADDATLTRDINLWKALPVEVRPVSYGPDETTKWEITWKSHVDTTKVSAGKALADFGLTAAT